MPQHFLLASYATYTLFTLLLHFSVSVCGQDACMCNKTDVRDGLKIFHRALDGEHWSNSKGWGTPAPVCSWYGVRCEGIALTLQLSDNNLAGTLTSNASSGLSESLVAFDVSRNNVVGTLPPEYALWYKLRVFDVSHNNLSGSIPSSYSNWTDMRRFRVEGNDLTHTLPVEFYLWLRLEHFYVSYNKLSGTLPPEYAAWGALITEFGAESNLLRGALPDEYSAWRSITWCFLWGNKLEGSLPENYGVWGRSIEAFSAGGQFLRGSIPTAYASWTSIRSFHVNKRGSHVRLNVGKSLRNVGFRLASVFRQSEKSAGRPKKNLSKI